VSLNLFTVNGRAELARTFYRTLYNTLAVSDTEAQPSLSDQSEYYYYTIGKTTPWSNAWANETNAESPLDSQLYVNEFRRNIMFAQRLGQADVCFMIRRIDWTPGTVYDQYDDAYGSPNLNSANVEAPLGYNLYTASNGATNLANSNFYVMTESYNVYKCLDNNLGNPSTIAPSLQGTEIESPGDGYKWKFMFQVQEADISKFLDAEYIPVRKVSGLPEFDINGQVDGISIVSGGTNYVGTPELVINGDGISASAVAVRDTDPLSPTYRQIVDVEITNIGSGYTFAVVEIVGGRGNTPVLQATVDLVAGEVTGVTVTDGGNGFQDPSDSDYVAPRVDIVGGGGKGALAEATVVNGVITAITMTDNGEGYTSTPTVTIVGGKGTDAVLDLSLLAPDGAPEEQSAVESTATAGTIDRIIVQNAGADYPTSNLQVLITGDGVGATANPVVNSDGQITSINVTNPGSGYTYADITFSAEGGALARAIISPPGGHGSNPVKELFATTVGIAATISDKDNPDLVLNNDFRQIGLVKNFYNYNKTAIWTNRTATTSKIINVGVTTDYVFAVDDIITTNTGGRYRVAQIIDNVTNADIHLQILTDLVPDPGNLSVNISALNADAAANLNPANVVLTNVTQDSTLTNLVINSVDATSPEINVGTGTVLYIENRPPINRSGDQAETIKLLVRF
jgi:hypothetical protein